MTTSVTIEGWDETLQYEDGETIAFPIFDGKLTVECDPSGVTMYQGNMQNFRTTWTGVVTVGNAEPQVISIEPGTCVPVTMNLGWTPPDSIRPHSELYLKGGPTLDNAPVDDMRWTSLGPNPDPEDNDSTGSGRVFAQRNPTLLGLLTHEAVEPGVDPTTPAHFAEGMRWTRSQGTRGCLFFIDEKLSPFLASEHPKIGVGLGYRQAGGGFNDLFNNNVPADWERVLLDQGSAGRQVGSSAHLTVESLMVCSAYYGSRAAARIAWATWQSVMSFFHDGEKWASRGYGWVFGAAADLVVISRRFPDIVDEEALMDDIRDVVDRLKSKNYLGMPAPDNGRTSEGGHLSYDEVKPTLSEPPFNWNEDKIKDAAKSDCLFFVGILMGGLDKLLTTLDAFNSWCVIPMRDHPTRKKLFEQYQVAAKFVIEQCWTYSYDIRAPLSQAWSRSASGLWMDCAARFRLAEGGGSHADMVGVMIRFVVGAVYRAAETLYLPEFEKVCAKTLEHCGQQGSMGYYGGNDRLRVFCEALWPTGRKDGWWLQ